MRHKYYSSSINSRERSSSSLHLPKRYHGINTKLSRHWIFLSLFLTSEWSIQDVICDDLITKKYAVMHFRVRKIHSTIHEFYKSLWPVEKLLYWKFPMPQVFVASVLNQRRHLTRQHLDLSKTERPNLSYWTNIVILT